MNASSDAQTPHPMKLSDFDFELPEELIAQEPLADRKASRMLVVDRRAESITDGGFSDIGSHMRAGDVLVVNDTKVFPARLNGISETGGRSEIFLIEELAPMRWEALAKPAKRLKEGKTISFGGGLSGTVLERRGGGTVVIGFECEGNFDDVVGRVGRTPLPPYIRRSKESPDSDRERYQTVFAKERGSIAAPTAGLHFTSDVLQDLTRLGVEIVKVTLHVGYGTFAPVRAENLGDHRVLGEKCEVGPEAAATVNGAKKEGRRVIAVGTTSTRTLESCASETGEIPSGRRVADLTITPGYRFRVVDGLLTNFHLPQSSLLILTSTFGGHDLIMNAYGHAVSQGYRFYSYGDCMLII